MIYESARLRSTSALGREYLEQQAENVFYRKATFYSAAEVDALLESTGFDGRIWLQTLAKPLAQIKSIEPVRPGTGHGAFVVVRAHSSSTSHPDSLATLDALDRPLSSTCSFSKR